MTTYELISLSISFLSFITVMFGLAYGALQLKKAAHQLSLTKIIHQQNHDWNRREAAQSALREYRYAVESSAIQSAFDYLNTNGPLSLDEIEKQFNQHESLKGDLHQLLNYYEGLARGINQGLYDEGVVKLAIKSSMVMANKGFQHYIEKRRSERTSAAWRQLSSIALKWDNEDNFIAARAQTGS